MTKTATFTVGDMSVPASVTQGVNVASMYLISGSGSVVQSQELPAGTRVATMDVPVGTGWRIHIYNRASDNSQIGAVIQSAPFDVLDDNHTIQVITGIEVS